MQSMPSQGYQCFAPVDKAIAIVRVDECGHGRALGSCAACKLLGDTQRYPVMKICLRTWLKPII